MQEQNACMVGGKCAENSGGERLDQGSIVSVRPASENTWTVQDGALAVSATLYANNELSTIPATMPKDIDDG